jgi:photosystem II stability/assembly factor-like uncharacterized protein
MKKIFLIASILFYSSVFPQSLLNSYLLQEENKLSKTSGLNPASNSISDIITIGDTIWIGTSRGVSLSTDRGETWTNFYGSEAFGNESVAAIGYYKGTFWASTAHSTERDGQSLPEGSGLRYTTNNGSTWHIISQPLDNPDDSLISYGINDGINLPRVRALPVTVAIQNLTYDIAFTPNTIWIVSFAGGLRKSTDMGETWQRVLLPSDNINEISPDDTIRFNLSPVSGMFGTGSLNHRAFSVIAFDDSILYVGTANGINKSTDGGISWRKFNHQNQDNPISGNFIVALAHNNNSIWAASWRTDDQSEFYGVSSSNNGGESWETFLEGERAHNFGFKAAQVFAPTDNGVFRSSNNGITWILPNTIFDEETKLAVTTNIFYSAGSNGNDIWLGSSDGLARLRETLFWQGEWKVYFASRPLDSANDAYVFPNPFSPRIDEGLKFKYTTEGKESSVTIRIFNFSMNYVATVIQNASRNLDGEYIEPVRWDGKDANGNTVPNGVYFYRIEIDSKEPVYGKVIVLQ